MKPDLSAVGTNFYTATQKFDTSGENTSGEMYDPTGYTVSQGTSFSTPLIAGAAALLKAARPGLSTAQYRFAADRQRRRRVRRSPAARGRDSRHERPFAC